MVTLAPAPVRECPVCQSSMEGKRSNAIYCSRTCKTRASDKRRVQDGREQVRNLARYASESERRKAYAIEYCKRFPEKAKQNKQRRRARMNEVQSFKITKRDWNRLVERFNHRCFYCDTYSDSLQYEHVVPISRGGSHGIGNLVPACASCNYSKHTSLIVEWRKRGGYSALSRRASTSTRPRDRSDLA